MRHLSILLTIIGFLSVSVAFPMFLFLAVLKLILDINMPIFEWNTMSIIGTPFEMIIGGIFLGTIGMALHFYIITKNSK